MRTYCVILALPNFIDIGDLDDVRGPRHDGADGVVGGLWREGDGGGILRNTQLDDGVVDPCPEN